MVPLSLFPGLKYFYFLSFFPILANLDCVTCLSLLWKNEASSVKIYEAFNTIATLCQKKKNKKPLDLILLE